MKISHFLLAVVLVLSVNYTAFADRELDRTEILQIFQHLTSQPKNTWIPAGTIEATHSEYRAPKITDTNELANKINQKVAEYLNTSEKRELTDELQGLALDAIPFNVRYELANEYTMDSLVTIRFDGDKFYWEINVTSRNDSVKPDASLRGNFMTNQFNLSWNARRILAWDGEKYTNYFLPANHATVDSATGTPHAVNGPLTAGVIPWGHGIYSYDKLAAAETTAGEATVDGQTQLYLTIAKPDGLEMNLTLDPAKDYAVTSYVRTYQNLVVMQQYSDYRQVSGQWVPMTITLERYEAAVNKLLSRDQWAIISISGDVPPADAFKIDFKPAAMVEHTSNTTNAVCLRTPDKTGNCATVALKYVASQFGKNVSDKKLASLVSKSENTTNLLAMKKFIKKAGLHCSAVSTDMQTLNSLKDCRVILHIAGKNHFVILDKLDGQDMKVIDPINKQVTAVDISSSDLSKCTALLISNRPIKEYGTEIPDTELRTIVGAAYSCNRLIQEYSVIQCDSPINGACGGNYVEYFTRYGCGPAPTGSCSTTTMIRYTTNPCIEDPEDPYSCTVTGPPTCYYMRACA